MDEGLEEITGIKETPEKKSPDEMNDIASDTSFNGTPKINKDFIKKFFVFLIFLFIILMLVFRLISNSGKKEEIEEDEYVIEDIIVPTIFQTKDSDYKPKTSLKGESNKRKDYPTKENTLKNNDKTILEPQKDYRYESKSYIQSKQPQKTSQIIAGQTEATNSSAKQSYGMAFNNRSSYDDLEYRRRRAPISVNVLGQNTSHSNETAYKKTSSPFPIQQNDYEAQNMQAQKKEFLRSKRVDPNTYLEGGYSKSNAPDNELKAGTFIPVALDITIKSDIAGPIIGKVYHDVYDSGYGNNILIPKGSKVIGSYDSEIAFGQDRVVIVWERIIRPDDVSINLPRMQGLDKSGTAGMSDLVDNHLTDIMKGTLLQSGFEIAVNSIMASMENIPLLSTLSSFSGEKNVGTTSREVAAQIFQRMINQQPTITIRAGSIGNIYVTKDIVLPVYKSIL